MYELMGSKREDDEFALQIAHSLLSLLAQQATRTVLLQSTQVSLAQPDGTLSSFHLLYASPPMTAWGTTLPVTSHERSPACWGQGVKRQSTIAVNCQAHIGNVECVPWSV